MMDIYIYIYICLLILKTGMGLDELSQKRVHMSCEPHFVSRQLQFLIFKRTKMNQNGKYGYQLWRVYSTQNSHARCPVFHFQLVFNIVLVSSHITLWKKDI